MIQSPAQIIVTADLTVNEDAQQVYKNKQLINLTDLSFQTLLALIKASPNVISTDELIDQVWQSIAVSPETVTQRIALLRKALSADVEANDKYIKSIRNKGYRWVPVVKKSKQSNFKINKWLILEIGFMSLFVYLILNQLIEFKSKAQTTATSQISSDDYTQQAWRYLDKHDAKSNQLAIELFEKSLQIQADRLDGLVGLSIAYSHAVSKFNQPHELLQKAISLAEKASILYTDEAKTWAALAFAHDVNGEIDTAMLFYQKSLNINPQERSAQGALAYLYGIKGELIKSLKMNLQLLDSDQEYTNLQIAQNLHLLGFVELADQWYQRADNLSPDNVFASNLRVRFLISNQRYQAAQHLLDEAILRGINRPELYTLQGILYMIEGKTSAASNSFDQALTIKNEDSEAQVWALIVSGEAEAFISESEDKWFNETSLWPTDIINRVVLYAAVGNREKMLIALKDAFNKGYMDSQWLLHLPPIKPYLSDPEFLHLLDKIQQKAGSQRDEILNASWLPKGFLDPSISVL